MVVIREWMGDDAPTTTPEVSKLKTRIKSALPEDNVLRLPVEYHDVGINTEYETHEDYINKFRERVLNKLQQLVNMSVETDPEIKSRKKMVQEVYAESMAHFALLRQLPLGDEDNETLEQVKKCMLIGVFSSSERRTRHLS